MCVRIVQFSSQYAIVIWLLGILESAYSHSHYYPMPIKRQHTNGAYPIRENQQKQQKIKCQKKYSPKLLLVFVLDFELLLIDVKKFAAPVRRNIQNMLHGYV